MRTNNQHLRWPAAGLALVVVAGFVVWRQQADPFDRAQSERLITAIQAGDISDAVQALAQGADPNYSPLIVRSPADSFRLQLHSLCFWDTNLRKGSVRAITAHEDTPLALAVRLEKVEMVKVLLTHGAKPDAPVQDGITPLMLAANHASRETHTPAIIAALLLDHGADPNAHSQTIPGSMPHTPLRMATFSPDPRPMVTLLLKKGATTNDPETMAQLQRLHIALRRH